MENNFYSQHGEDAVIDFLFDSKSDGYFIEIGCIDGRRFSNTLHFEKKGWKGICVEAHAGFIDMLQKNRPNSIVIHSAVSNEDSDAVTFYANSRGSLSTLDKSQEEHFQKNYGKFFTGFEEQKVPMQTMTTILNQQEVPAIDFVSLDIEGHEIEALEGYDLNKYGPKLFVIECDDQEHEEKLNNILFPAGYKLALKVSLNNFYTNDERIIEKAKSINMKVDITHTQHPIDDIPDKSKTIKMNTKNMRLIYKFFGTVPQIKGK